MKIRIPYPIPEPERTRLKAAGAAAVASRHDDTFSAIVRKVIKDIEFKHGFEEPEKSK